MRYLSLFFAVVLSFVTPATAATGVGGEITTTTWTKANGPYYVLSTVTVPAGNTLTIEPGVDVIFEIFETEVQFIVQGRLYAVGTATDNIRMIGSTSPWGGLTLSGGDTSTLKYARISDVSNVRAALNATNSARVGMTNVQISQNRGGGVYSDGSTLTLENCTITGNSAGGLSATSSSALALTNCTISGNSAGGLNIHSSIATLTNCTITRNSASSGGGLSATSSSALALTNCTISGNSASSGGGLLATSSATLTLENCTITGNSASSYGGGLYASSATLTLTNCRFTANSASNSFDSGGGLFASSSTVMLTNCAIIGNSAPYGNGGGLLATSSATLTLENCTITGNWTWYGNGGGLFASSSTVMLTNCTVNGNSTRDGNGGGLNTSSSTAATFVNCVITGNSAPSGGGLYALGSTATLTNCTMNRNTASQYGGGLYMDGSTATLKNTILWANGAQEYHNVSSTITATYSDIYHALFTFPGTGNINADPLFVDAENGDYHLQAGSPCIDAGDPTSPLDPDGTRANIGAFDFSNQGGTGVGPPFVGGTITTTTWTRTSSPYRVTSTITVQSGNTLTIEPGVDVLFDSDVQFVVQGRLQAVGTETDSIRFITGAATQWGGIRISGGDTSTVTYARISGSTGNQGGGISIIGSGTRLGLAYAVISGNKANTGSGLSVVEALVTLTKCTVSNNSATATAGGLWVFSNAIAILTNCTIANNSAPSGGGLYVYYYSARAMLVNCIVTSNSGGGLHIESSSGGVKATYSNIQGGYTGKGVYSGTSNINADPLFVDGVNGNYRLQPDSPCIDAGDPTSPLDPDGTRADMGAIPFTQEGNLPPIWISVLDTTVVYDELLEFSVTAHDPNGDSLVYNAPILPTGAMFVDSTFRWTPVVGQVGDTLAVFSVTDGEFTVYDTVWISVTLPVSVSLSVPASFNLAQNAPNPFNPSTTIRFSLADDGLTSLSIYDVSGRLVQTLVHESFQSGEHSVVWDGTDAMGRHVASGVYLYRLTSHEGVVTRRMTLVR